MQPQSQKRREDIRFTTGAGCYTADIRMNQQLHLVFVRSPYAHAQITRIDCTAALAAKGVVAVITGTEMAADGIKAIPGGFRFARPDGRPCPTTNRPGLASEIVRHAGEAVAAVVARTLDQAQAAAELVAIDYEDLPATVGFAALEQGAPVIWANAPDNIAFRWQGGDLARTEAALQTAAHVTRLDLEISRVAINPMEPRNILVVPSRKGRLLIHASHQSPYTLLDGLASVGFDRSKIAIEIKDVGGSFGLKMGIAPEDVVVVYAARKLRRPVFWQSTRSEAFLADDHGRGLRATGEIGFDKNGKIVGLNVAVKANLGAYVSGKSGWSLNNIGGIAGVYLIPTIAAQVEGFFTNSVQSAAYRGAGRPEATYIIERLLDVAARELGDSPFDLRRRNLIPSSAMPYQTALIFNYDCGDFAANMAAAEKLADLKGFAERRAEAKKRGLLRGLGVCNCIEVAGGPIHVLAPDIARVSLLSSGRLRVHTGSVSVGQGHETTFTQMVADRFGVPADQIDYLQGDTDTFSFGRGNGGSSALPVGGTAVTLAAGRLVSKLTALAAAVLGSETSAISLSEGIFRTREGNQTLSLADLAARVPQAVDGVAAESEATFKPPEVTFPNGTHICEVEIDPDTGVTRVVGYNAVEDIGTVIHPMLAEGQIQGGVAQGLGQAMGEEIIYDASGQLLTGTFMDYQMPRAADLPNYTLGFNPVPTKSNPMGAKGVGEAGTVGALAAAMNAVNDALAQAEIRNFDMPATPLRIWQALHVKA